jgi:superfamily II DNA/RNA helicase
LQGNDVATSWRVRERLQAGLVIPDLWQQEAVRALQQGKDVVVQAPTGSGKTYIFELLYPNLKTQAVFTVPTRPVTTGSGTEPNSITAAPARDANPRSNDRKIDAS